ncbi:prepilin-type cleavage/methylation domain-containing protein [Moritella marina ATCC 15381]|uniref:Prepilin-type cleavage/methylation domain-containing protein n=1 Tax=Moritella marina ATCC 15381 TaxID=1202962 RepID=A0A5J6WM45_MORMI|nr:PilW family protein [Moritella marina]QFI39117.1 prepilin-type cleavage/methylation domain-containing protein [Moritella marina ATCC 15381]
MKMKQMGFNLVELMIALVVGIVLMTSITTMFVDTKVSVNRSSTVSNLQQQAQLALQVLVEDVRSIGSWAEFSGEPLADIMSPAMALAAGSCSLFPTAGGNTTATLSEPQWANWVEIASAGTFTESDCINDSDGAGYSLAANSDVLSLARIQGNTVTVAAMTTTDYYLAVSPQQTQLFKASALNGATNIDNAEFYPYLHHTYFVETHATSGPRLTRFSRQGDTLTNDLIVGNIEAFRIEFGVDTSIPRDGSADSYYLSNDASFTAEMWSNNQLVSARIYVLARATNPDLTFNNDANYNLRFTPFTPTANDNYRRFLLSTTVVIRNNIMAVTR